MTPKNYLKKNKYYPDPALAILAGVLSGALVGAVVGALIVFAYSTILDNTTLSIFLFISFIIILYTHRENIVRLKDSKETKIKL